eukprot:Platyproteum_vivax@DN4455_c0_g1_i2.p1
MKSSAAFTRQGESSAYVPPPDFSSCPMEIVSLPTWSSLKSDDDGAAYFEGPVEFTVDHEINRIVRLAEADILTLEVDGIVHFTNSTFDSSEPLSQTIMKLGGDLLKADLEQVTALDPIRTGEVRVTNAYRLPASHLLHACGPLYNPKYTSAAENSLTSSIREALKAAVDLNLTSISFPAFFNTATTNTDKMFPPGVVMHTMLRTIRRWLEILKGKFTNIVVTCASRSEFELFNSEYGMALYFPRNLQELLISQEYFNLNEEATSNKYGEREVEDRVIRISMLKTGDGSDELTSSSDSNDIVTAQVDSSFCVATESKDELRKKRLHNDPHSPKRSPDSAEVEALEKFGLLVHSDGNSLTSPPVYKRDNEEVDHDTAASSSTQLPPRSLVEQVMDDPLTVAVDGIGWVDASLKEWLSR